MRTEVHTAALRAAAKVAFSIALINVAAGCSAEGVDEKGDDETSASEAAVTSGDKASAKKPAAESAYAAKADAAAPSACATTLAAAFPTPLVGWESVAVSAEVLACCREELVTNPWQTPYHSKCCSAQLADERPASPDAGADAPLPIPDLGLMMACTPWGPPVPPSMKRIAKRRGAPSREVLAFLSGMVA